jgi:hypothetical protein
MVYATAQQFITDSLEKDLRSTIGLNVRLNVI